MRAFIHEFPTQGSTALADQISIPRSSSSNTSREGTSIASLANSQWAVLKTYTAKPDAFNGGNVTYTRAFDAGNHGDLLVEVQFGSERFCFIQRIVPATRACCVRYSMSARVISKMKI